MSLRTRQLSFPLAHHPTVSDLKNIIFKVSPLIVVQRRRINPPAGRQSTMNDDGLLARMGGHAGRDMVSHSTFNVVITGWQHSNPFQSRHILPNETVLFPIRERRAFSFKEDRDFVVRPGDTDAVVLSLQDRDPSDGGMTRAEWDLIQAGYLGFETDGRYATVELMDRADTAPHVKIMVVYSDVDHKKWIRAGGISVSGCNGRAYVFIDRDKQDELGSVVQGILTANDVA